MAGGKLRGADSTPGPLKLDEGAHVVTGEDQRLTGHTGALLCLALLDNRLLFSSSTDLTIKACLAQTDLPLGGPSYMRRSAAVHNYSV